jgi:hypothetical protein
VKVLVYKRGAFAMPAMQWDGGHTSVVSHVAFGSSGLLARASADRLCVHTAQGVKVRECALLLPLHCLAFSGDGACVAGMNTDGDLVQAGVDARDAAADVDAMHAVQAAGEEEDVKGESLTQLKAELGFGPDGELLAQPQNEDEARAKQALQPAFQPGSTPWGSDRRRILAWNVHGSITSRQDGEKFNVEVEFAESSSRRAVRFTEDRGYQLAALASTGAVFASARREDAGEDLFRGDDADGDEEAWVLYQVFDRWVRVRGCVCARMPLTRPPPRRRTTPPTSRCGSDRAMRPCVWQLGTSSAPWPRPRVCCAWCGPAGCRTRPCCCRPTSCAWRAAAPCCSWCTAWSATWGFGCSTWGTRRSGFAGPRRSQRGWSTARASPGRALPTTRWATCPACCATTACCSGGLRRRFGFCAPARVSRACALAGFPRHATGLGCVPCCRSLARSRD